MNECEICGLKSIDKLCPNCILEQKKDAEDIRHDDNQRYLEWERQVVQDINRRLYP